MYIFFFFFEISNVYTHIYIRMYIVLCYIVRFMYAYDRKKALKFLSDTKEGSIKWNRFHR